jgi:hypothetical protein
MKAMLIATAGKNSNVIDISLTSDYAQDWTAQAVNRAAELYLEEHVKVHRTQGVSNSTTNRKKSCSIS